MRSKYTSKQLADELIKELHTMQIDFPVGAWGDSFVDKSVEYYYSFARKNSFKTFVNELEKVMIKNPQTTINNEFAVSYVCNKVYNRLSK